MNTRSFAWAGARLSLLAAVALLITSCTMGAKYAVSSGGLRVWIDQPITGYTLAPQPLTLKAHARQAGGGVQEIRFMVNGTPLGEGVRTDEGQELIEATTEWNPSVEGWYLIQAVAISNAGQATSEVSRICISRSANGPCPVAASPVPAAVDPNMRVEASPNPVSFGAACDPADRIVHFTATVPDTAGARRVIINGYLVSASGVRVNFALALEPGTTTGSYAGAFDLGTMDQAFLGGEDGRLEYAVALTNDDGEIFRTSETKTLPVHNCGGAAPTQGVVKVGGFPNGVFIGKCTPTEIDFEAGTDIEPRMFNRVDMGYEWIDNASHAIGTPTRAAMTSNGSGGYALHLDVNTAPAGMRIGGIIKYWAILVNRDNTDVASSPVESMVITPCATVQPGITPVVCSNYRNQQKQCVDAGCYYWKDNSCNRDLEPAAPTCASYYNRKAQCRAAGCWYWSDKTCNDSEEPAAPTCDSFFKNPDGCQNAGCYYWSDNTCSDYAEPAPPVCKSYTNDKDCNAAGCSWDVKGGYCY